LSFPVSFLTIHKIKDLPATQIYDGKKKVLFSKEEKQSNIFNLEEKPIDTV